MKDRQWIIVWVFLDGREHTLRQRNLLGPNGVCRPESYTVYFTMREALEEVSRQRQDDEENIEHGVVIQSIVSYQITNTETKQRVFL